MVRGDLVQQDQLIKGESATIQCMHRDNVLYPMASATINLDGLNFNVRAAVSKPLPMSVLLGTDVLQLEHLLRGNPARIYSQGVKQVLVTTRSQTRNEDERVDKLKEKFTATAKPMGVGQRGVDESTNNREGEAAVGEGLVNVNSQDEEAAAEGRSFDAGSGGEDVLERDDLDVWGLLDEDLFIHTYQRQQQTKQKSKPAGKNIAYYMPWTRARTTLR